jgi:CRISPR-associated protein (Cas_Cmr3)
LEELDWLLLGGEFRLARLWWQNVVNEPLPDYLAFLREAPLPPSGDGPFLLKWVLVTPAIFAHGSLPGWCWNQTDGRPPGEVRLGASRRKRNRVALPGRARLVSACLGKPRTVSGWDVVDGCAKPTMLAVPEGSVYYFLCQNGETAAELARKLHWQPRSDFYGEKGCGYGFVSFDVQMHPTSPDVSNLANELLKG